MVAPAPAPAPPLVGVVLPGGPTGLSTFQKEWLHRIWKSNRRELIDVRPTDEDAEGEEGGNVGKGGQGTTKKDGGKNNRTLLAEGGHTYAFVVRLFHFFGAVVAPTTSNSTTTPTARRHHHGWLREILHSCGCWTGGTVVARSTAAAAILPHGRRVLVLPHAQFLTDLDTYELNGKERTPDFVRRHSFGAFLHHVPNEALSAIACALRLVLALRYVQLLEEQQRQQHPPGSDTDDHHPHSDNERSKRGAAILNQFLDHSQLVVRFVRVEPQIPMRDVKTSLVGKLVSIRGHVVKARPKQLRVATSDFGCTKCGTIRSHVFVRGRYSIPSQPCKSCRSKTYTLLRSTARYTNVQELRLQESPDESTTQAGRTPRQLRVELTHELVGACRPGDTVLVAAIVDAVSTTASSSGAATGRRVGNHKRATAEASTYELFLLGHSVTSLSETRSDGTNDNASNSSHHLYQPTAAAYTAQQLQAITQVCHADHKYFGLMERRAFPFDLLVRSLCPSIIGHHAVKAGLLLSLLGGTPPTTSSCSSHSSSSSSSATSANREHTVRYNSHVLIVGDPGMGKSQMLLAASQLATRSVYVGGNTSSTTGLTVTLTKEAGSSGESGMEVGALVLSDLGVCAIDEADKMAKSHQDGLLEAMEQQQVSIAKAGVVATLPARCSVIAAANPKHGSYNMSQTVAENLTLSKPILSRFDLVFILRDRADKAQDQLVSSNIINLYRNRKSHPPGSGTSSCPSASAAPSPTRFSPVFEEVGAARPDSENRLSLSQRLAWVHEFQTEPLPASLLRDYIAYAREYCKPKLTPEAAVVLKEYYMQLRYPLDGRRPCDTVPITTRQLEALIRLCQARAKACLRDYVLKEDALDVVELMSLSVEQVHRDESGIVDPGRGGAGGRSNRAVKKAFVAELHRMVGPGAECGMDDLRRIAERVQCGLGEFQSLVEDLRLQGVLLKKSSGKYKVVS